MHTFRASLFVLLLGVASAAWALAPIPAPTGYVTDQVGVIEPEVIAPLQIRLARYEQRTGRKFVVLLVEDTAGEALEAYADRVLEAWRLGEARGGAALLLWTAEGYILIRAVGPVLESLGGPVQEQILGGWVVPEFAQGRAGLGIRNGVDRMIAVADGGEVMSPDAVPEAQTSPPDMATDAEVPADPVIEPEVSISFEAASLGPWAQDLERLLGGFRPGFMAGMAAWYSEALRQAGDLPVVVRGLLLQANGERVEPPFNPIRIAALYALGAVLLIAVILLARGAPTAALIGFGGLGGLAAWAATGFTALALGMVVIGLAAPVLVPVLRVLLRGADDSEREPAMPRPQAEARRARPVSRPRVAGVSPPSSVLTPRPLPTDARQQAVQARLHQMQPTLRRIEAIARAEARQLRPVHGIALFAFFILQPALAILVVLGGVLYKAYRSGIAYLLADVFVVDPALRQRLKQRLPRPTGTADT